jgi:hypothetical protein
MALMPRFVLLYHDCPPTYSRPSHWDFMLETGDVMRTWALTKLPRAWHTAREFTMRVAPRCPDIAEADKVKVDALGDHRRDYLEYEGDLSGNRGRVFRIANGTFQEEWETPIGWCVSLQGTAINGLIELDDVYEDGKQWTLTVLG